MSTIYLPTENPPEGEAPPPESSTRDLLGFFFSDPSWGADALDGFHPSLLSDPSTRVSHNSWILIQVGEIPGPIFLRLDPRWNNTLPASLRALQSEIVDHVNEKIPTDEEIPPEEIGVSVVLEACVLYPMLGEGHWRSAKFTDWEGHAQSLWSLVCRAVRRNGTQCFLYIYCQRNVPFAWLGRTPHGLELELAN